MDSSEDGTQMWNGNEIVKLHLKSYKIQFHKNRIGCSKDSFFNATWKYVKWNGKDFCKQLANLISCYAGRFSQVIHID